MSIEKLFTLQLPNKMMSIVKNDYQDKQHIGNDYYNLLDTYDFGIVCKAGIRDYLVAKYVEFGACHVFPVGDCPSYMPIEMKRMMVNVEGMTDVAIVNELQRLMSNRQELVSRQDAYAVATHRYFDRETHSRRLFQQIMTT